MTNFDQGLILGLTMPWWGSAIKEIGREPVAYLYGAVTLPTKLPEYDSAEFPYVYIFWNNDYVGTKYEYVLYMLSHPLYFMETTIDTGGNVFEKTLRFAPIDDRDAASGQFFYFYDGAWTKPIGGSSWGYSIKPTTCLIDDATRCLKWANVSVPKEDGSVFFDTYTPVYVGNEMTTYIGAVLPKVPEWDEKTYPYLMIVKYSNGYTAYATSDKNHISYKPSSADLARDTLIVVGPQLYISINDGRTYWCNYDATVGAYVDGYWAHMSNNSSSNLFLDYKKTPIEIVWSNYDVYDEDGVLYFAKCSDPTPLY